MKHFFAVVMIAVALAALYGYIANVISWLGMLDGPLSAMFIARIVGLLLAPLGAILGYF